MNPSERAMRARLAAHVMHSKNDSRETSRPGRDAFLARFEREVDPDCVLPTDERARRAEHARKAYFTSLALKSAQARRARTGVAEADSGDAVAEPRPSMPANEGQDRASNPLDLSGGA